MCLHSQAKTHAEIGLKEGIKHDLRAAISRVDVSLVPDEFIESEDWRMKETTWKTLRQLIKPPPNPHK
jgi:hypothetical protein